MLCCWNDVVENQQQEQKRLSDEKEEDGDVEKHQQQQQFKVSSTSTLSSASSTPSYCLFVTIQSIVLISLSMFLHSSCDVFLHVDDAYSQFLPISKYKFHSYISYWDVQYYAHVWILIESLIVWYSIYYILLRIATRDGRNNGGRRHSTSCRNNSCFCCPWYCCLWKTFLYISAVTYLLNIVTTYNEKYGTPVLFTGSESEEVEDGV